MFYNGVSTDFHLKLNNTEIAHSSNLINSGAFMTNFIVKFAFGNSSLTPAQVWARIGRRRPGATSRSFAVVAPLLYSGGASSGSLAWDVVAGADFYPRSA